MSATAVLPLPKPKPASLPRRISLERFLHDFNDIEDGFKYEWNNGEVEKSSKINQQQSNFFFTLLRAFFKTKAAKEGGGLIFETDMMTVSGQLRRPDIAFYSVNQQKRMKTGENQIAPFIVEVISPTDNADRINKKLEEYFLAGVLTVWHIFPDSQQVYVFSAIDQVAICRGKTLCSGGAALPDLAISADELFV